jgi:PTH1 family peptidyl-tRNA hydrolase
MNNYLLIGLGNPGKKYDHTRHNFGIHVLRHWFSHTSLQPGHQIKEWSEIKKHSSSIATIKTPQATITCLFPLTFMNSSGLAVKSYLHRKLLSLWRQPAPHNILIIHDEATLPLGKFKFVSSGSARGHNGVRSIHDYLKTKDIPRLKLGIGNQVEISPDFVLGQFTPSEQPIVDDVTNQCTPLIDQFITNNFSLPV